ncbi:MAG: hypothetical protein B9S32_03550 [Verrucomicrobia bacterium Tous-C9LFEB]|nr:MAG: hypothetical protein B9S32_03550 [Verrucomicrobia bacterium Tous-C9LFEB]
MTDYWAPGILNQEAGTVEMDLKFLRSREEMLSDYFFVFRATGNSSLEMTTVLGLVFCPPGDNRDFLALARSNAGASAISPEALDFEANKIYRLAFTWGEGQHSFWLNGKLLGRGALKGPLALLPDRFRAGKLGAFEVERLRVSDLVRSGVELQKREELKVDGHTTLWDDRSLQQPVLGKSIWQEKTFGVWAFPERTPAMLVVPVGQSLPVPLRLVNFTSNDSVVEIKCDLFTRLGKATGTQLYKIPIKSGAFYIPGALSLPVMSQPGYYNVKIAVKSPQGREAIYDCSYVVQPEEKAAAGKLADYLGHHHHFNKPDAYTQIGIRWHRAWGNERSFLWCNVEPSPGEFQWAQADEDMAAAKKAGIQVLGVLGYPPTWASSRSEAEVNRLKGKAAPDFLRRPERFKPKNLADWEKYVRAVVRRYHGQVKHWEIYNEVDFHPPFVFASFSGSTEDYYQLLESAHRIIKEIDPAAQVLTSGFSLSQGATDTGMPAALMKLGAAKSFDIFNVHGYAGRNDTIAAALTAARAAKPNVPLWQTERQYMGGFQDEYEAISTAFWCLDNGFSKFFFHEADMDRFYGNLKPTPYYAVTAELARQLRVCDEYVGKIEGLDGVCTGWKLKRTDGGWLYVFAANSGVVRLSLGADKEGAAVTVTDLYGEFVSTGKLDLSKPFNFSGLIYLVSPVPLKIAKVERLVGNAVANPGFEMREGDYLMDPTAARPVYWKLSAEDPERKNFGYIKGGHTGECAIRFANGSNPKGVWVSQSVTLDSAGEWILSAWVRIPKGAPVRMIFSLQAAAQLTSTAGNVLTVEGTGDWQQLVVKQKLAQSGIRGTIIVGVQEGAGVVDVDDVELLPQLKATP